MRCGYGLLSQLRQRLLESVAGKIKKRVKRQCPLIDPEMPAKRAAVTVDWNKTDKYGRTIGKVIVNGQDANLSQLQEGLAWHYKQYEKEQSAPDRGSYAQAEIDARTRKIGLWHDAVPIAPWDFRHHTIDNSFTSRQQPDEHCSCISNSICTGPRGGRYCLTAGGKKKYL